jgi:hypothetical protein
MKIWTRLAVAAAVAAGFAMPVYAADGDGLQSHENTQGATVERNPVVSPSSQATRMPTWNGRFAANMHDDALTAQPSLEQHREATTLQEVSPPITAVPSDTAAPSVVSPSMSGPSAAEESRATGKVDAQQASPPRTGADVQAGDMGPSNAKAGGSQ